MVFQVLKTFRKLTCIFLNSRDGSFLYVSVYISEYELTLLKLFDSITNGTRIEINETGTRILFRPGLLSGGSFELDCGTGRPISYYLETVIYLAPFAKKPVSAKLFGVSNIRDDISVDSIKASLLSVMKRFILDTEGLEIKVRQLLVSLLRNRDFFDISDQ